MNDFLAFRKMVTPVFIQVIFWIAVLMSVVAAIYMMTQSFIVGFIMLFVGPFMMRIYCELLIIMFRIYDELVAIRTGTPPGGQQQGFPVMPPPATYMPPPQQH